MTKSHYERMTRRLIGFVLWLACIFGCFIALLMMFCYIIGSPRKYLGIAIAIDRAANASLNGDYNETISSRAHRAMQNGKKWGCILCKFLNLFQKDHCSRSAGK